MTTMTEHEERVEQWLNILDLKLEGVQEVKVVGTRFWAAVGIGFGATFGVTLAGICTSIVLLILGFGLSLIGAGCSAFLSDVIVR